jgi:hypothetical protein
MTDDDTCVDPSDGCRSTWSNKPGKGNYLK